MHDVEKYLREERFKDHVVTYHSAELPDGSVIETLRWGRPDNDIYEIQYLQYGNALLVKGDLGTAIYEVERYGNKRMRYWTGTDITYFSGKCRTSSGSEDELAYRRNHLIGLKMAFEQLDSNAETEGD